MTNTMNNKWVFKTAFLKKHLSLILWGILGVVFATLLITSLSIGTVLGVELQKQGATANYASLQQAAQMTLNQSDVLTLFALAGLLFTMMGSWISWKRHQGWLHDLTNVCEQLAYNKSYTAQNPEMSDILTCYFGQHTERAKPTTSFDMMRQLPIAYALFDKQSSSIIFANDPAKESLLSFGFLPEQTTLGDILSHLFPHAAPPHHEPTPFVHNGATFTMHITDSGSQETLLWYPTAQAQSQSTPAPVISNQSDRVWQDLQILSEALGNTSATQSVYDQATLIHRTSKNSMSTVSSINIMAQRMSDTGRNITQHIDASQQSIVGANTLTNDAMQTIERLSFAAKEVGDVVNLINDIAEQTSLLALNASIEAASAGEAGRGFAVVAHEVKNLANETAKATDSIATRIRDIQGVTKTVVEAIGAINRSMQNIMGSSTAIATTIERQNESARSIVKYIHDIDRTMKTLEKESHLAEQNAQTAMGNMTSLASHARDLLKIPA